MTKSSMCLKVEFTAGTHIMSAITEAKELAIKLDLAYVLFNFNSKTFFIGQTTCIEDAMIDYEDSSMQHIVHY